MRIASWDITDCSSTLRQELGRLEPTTDEELKTKVEFFDYPSCESYNRGKSKHLPGRRLLKSGVEDGLKGNLVFLQPRRIHMCVSGLESDILF